MGKRKEITAEAAARKELIRELLKNSDVRSLEDVMGLFKEAVAEFVNTGLQEEMTEHLGYGRYDYSGKKTDNSRNGSTSKKLRTSMGDSDISDHIRDIYGMGVSESTISRVTDAVLPRMREWQQRPLESMYL